MFARGLGRSGRAREAAPATVNNYIYIYILDYKYNI